MADFNDFREQRRKWREERRKMRDEWREKFYGKRGYMMRHDMVIRGRIWTGVFVLLIGVVVLLKNSNVLPPEWIWIWDYKWQVFLIALGIFLGLRHNFRGIVWLVLILVGGGFLLNHLHPEYKLDRYVGPFILILLGLFFIFRPRRHWHWIMEADEKKSSDEPVIGGKTETYSNAADSKDDYINTTSVFGGAKKNILSKNFRGGEIVNIFGGTELDLSQADINGEAVIEMTTIFGGTKLVVPSNWTVKSEAAVIFGGVEDKRPLPAINEPAGKTLTLRGTVIFGGIDIKNY